jgi:(4S)-4-hydroxy-5-phosphonooxypentane-2,3-dione isomerase
MAFVVVAKWTAKPGEEEAVAEALLRLVEPSRAEPGNLVYQPHRDPSDASVFMIYEQYVDEAAFKTHLESDHLKEIGLGEAVPRLAERYRESYETI